MAPRFVSKTFPNHYSLVTGLNEEIHGVLGRGLHSSTFELNVSALYGTGGVFRGHSGGVYEVSGGVGGTLGCVFLSETAQVVLRSGRV